MWVRTLDVRPGDGLAGEDVELRRAVGRELDVHLLRLQGGTGGCEQHEGRDENGAGEPRQAHFDTR